MPIDITLKMDRSKFEAIIEKKPDRVARHRRKSSRAEHTNTKPATGVPTMGNNLSSPVEEPAEHNDMIEMAGGSLETTPETRAPAVEAPETAGAAAQAEPGTPAQVDHEEPDQVIADTSPNTINKTPTDIEHEAAAVTANDSPTETVKADNAAGEAVTANGADTEAVTANDNPTAAGEEPTEMLLADSVEISTSPLDGLAREWTKDEDELLLAMMANYRSYKDIKASLGRSRDELRARFASLAAGTLAQEILSPMPTSTESASPDYGTTHGQTEPDPDQKQLKKGEKRSSAELRALPLLELDNGTVLSGRKTRLVHRLLNHYDEQTKWILLAEQFEEKTGKRLDPMELKEKMEESYEKIRAMMRGH